MSPQQRVEVLEHTVLEMMRALNGLIGAIEESRIDDDGPLRGHLRILGDSLQWTRCMRRVARSTVPFG